IRRYVAVLLAMTLAVAAIAVLYTRQAAAENARRNAVRDTKLEGAAAAHALEADIAGTRTNVDQLAASPAAPQIFSAPNDCSLAIADDPLFTDGHLDVVRDDGTIACSSLPVA